MKKKTDFRIYLIVILTVILIIMCWLYFKDNDSYNTSEIEMETSVERDTTSKTNTTNKKTIKTTSEVVSALTEEVKLRATYYLSESYVEEGSELKKGENILKYTNGKYLVAPYDCIVGEISIPETSEQCTNDHYVEVSSSNILAVKINVDESNINNLSIGQEAKIEISAYEEKTVTGTITSISNIAQNGKFEVKIEFENDGEIKIGMTANIEI